MKPSHRIKLIKDIVEKLSGEEYGIIDLTLKQFQLPTSETFSGSKANYIIEHIAESSNDQLSGLAEHLELMISDGFELNPGFWEESFFRVFISHLASDKENAELLKVKLANYGISGFVAHSDIEPTKEWQEQIELALRTCDSLVALMIPGFQNSNWTDQEIGFALGRDLLIIPVRMGRDPYGFIGKYQAITFRTFDLLANDIYLSLLKNKKTALKIAYATVYRFKKSRSFKDAKDNFLLLNNITEWSPELINILETSIENNDQIKHSFGVPEKVKSLVTKLRKG